MLVLFSGWDEKSLERNKFPGHYSRQYGILLLFNITMGFVRLNTLVICVVSTMIIFWQ